MAEQQLGWMRTNEPLVPGPGVARTADIPRRRAAVTEAFRATCGPVAGHASGIPAGLTSRPASRGPGFLPGLAAGLSRRRFQ